jgi:hypothetical protein
MKFSAQMIRCAFTSFRPNARGRTCFLTDREGDGHGAPPVTQAASPEHDMRTDFIIIPHRPNQR